MDFDRRAGVPSCVSPRSMKDTLVGTPLPRCPLYWAVRSDTPGGVSLRRLPGRLQGGRPGAARLRSQRALVRLPSGAPVAPEENGHLRHHGPGDDRRRRSAGGPQRPRNPGGIIANADGAEHPLCAVSVCQESSFVCCKSGKFRITCCREQLWLFRSRCLRKAESLGEKVARYEFAGKIQSIAGCTAERS